MAKIRKDLEGVVVAAGAYGEAVILRAGDKVPDGIEVGDHVLQKKPGTAQDDGSTPSGTEGAGSPATPAAGPTQPAGTGSLTPPPLVGAGSSTDAWREYAKQSTAAAGLTLEIADDAKRGDIVEALKTAGIATE
jgi:hypothetical protein